MATKLKQIVCDPPCNFTVKGSDEDELMEYAVQHAKKKHGMTFTPEQIKDMKKTMIKDA